MDKVNKNESSTYALVSRLDERTAAFAESLKNLAEENRRIGENLVAQIKDHMEDDTKRFEKYEGKLNTHMQEDETRFKALERFMLLGLGLLALAAFIIANLDKIGKIFG